MRRVSPSITWMTTSKIKIKSNPTFYIESKVDIKYVLYVFLLFLKNNKE